MSRPSNDYCDDAYALSDFVRGENGFYRCGEGSRRVHVPLADVVDGHPMYDEEFRKDGRDE